MKEITALFFALGLLFLTGFSFADQHLDILHVAGWDVYADPENKNKTIGYKSFEEQYDVIIEFTPLSNLDEIIHAAESDDKYDVFLISNEGIELLYSMNLAQPLDLEKIPHYQELHHNLLYTAWSMFETRVYAAPWAWGPTGLLYNEDLIDEPDSWGILWNTQYQNRVTLWDDISMIWTTALYLGYDNIYNLTQGQLGHVKDALFELNKNAYPYYKGETEAIECIQEDDVVAMNSWFDPSRRLKEKGFNFKMVIPKEGAVGMFDSYMLSHNTDNLEFAYKYINHQISPNVQLMMSRITGLAPANIETLHHMTKEEIKALHLDEEDYFSRMILWDNMPRKHLYQEVLNEVRRDMERKQSLQ